MTACRNETEAHLALAAAAMDRAINAASDRRIGELAREDVPPDPALRQPGEPVRVPIGEADVPPAAVPVTIGREDIRPGMRMIGGEWFYSAAWL